MREDLEGLANRHDEYRVFLEFVLDDNYEQFLEWLQDNLAKLYSEKGTKQGGIQ